MEHGLADLPDQRAEPPGPARLGAARLLSSAAHALQRRVRPVAPALVARLTWTIKRLGGGHALAAIDALVKPGDAVVDAGANWGLYAARLAQLAGRAGQVDAFEPHPAHARTLRALALRRPQLVVQELALADAPGSATLHVPILGAHRVTALASLRRPAAGVAHERVTVRVDTLDAALSGRRAPSFVKVDVEGSEFAVLQGAVQTLRATRPTLLVEIEQRHQDGPIAGTFAYLEALGYAGHFFAPGGLAPLADFDVERDQLRHLAFATPEYGMPAGYVADFLFADPGLDVARLLADDRRTVSTRHAPAQRSGRDRRLN